MIQWGSAANTVRNTQGNITNRLGLIPRLIPLPSCVVRPAARGYTQHNVNRRSGGAWPEAVPAAVVGERGGGVAPGLEAANPRGFLASRHPELLGTVALAEGHDVAHRWGSVAR